MYGLVVGSVALVSADNRVLLDPSSADLGLVSGMKTATRVLLCGMPALASVTCLNVSAGSGNKSDGQPGNATSAAGGAGIEANPLDNALTACNASLVDIHKVVAQALADDFQRRTALTNSTT